MAYLFQQCFCSPFFPPSFALLTFEILLYLSARTLFLLLHRIDFLFFFYLLSFPLDVLLISPTPFSSSNEHFHISFCCTTPQTPPLKRKKKKENPHSFLPLFCYFDEVRFLFLVCLVSWAPCVLSFSYSLSSTA